MATHFSGHAKGDMGSFDVKKQIDHGNEKKMMQENSFHGPDFRELGGDESVRRTKSDDVNAFTLFSFIRNLLPPRRRNTPITLYISIALKKTYMKPGIRCLELKFTKTQTVSLV